MSRNYAKNSQN